MRAAELSALWYDWVGVCLLVGFIILLAYYTFQTIETFRVGIGPKILEFKGVMRRDVLFKPNSVMFFVLRWFSTLLALESLVVVTSFLIGMFKDMGLGLRVLQFSVAAVASILALLAVYILVRLFWELSTGRRWGLLVEVVKKFILRYRAQGVKRRKERLKKRRKAVTRRAAIIGGLTGRRVLHKDAKREHGTPSPT